MFRRYRWIILLVLTLVLTLGGLPRVFAASGAATRLAAPSLTRQAVLPAHTLHQFSTNSVALNECLRTEVSVHNPIPSVNTGPTLIITSNNWLNTSYFCGAGYAGKYIEGVNEVYNNGGGPAWFKWYRNGVGHYCAFKGLGSYQNFDPPVKITQIDYGDKHASDKCGNSGGA